MAKKQRPQRPAGVPQTRLDVQQENLRRFTLKSWAASAQVLSQRRDLAALQHVSSFLHWLGDKNMEAIKQNHPALPCRAGCAWCCYVGADRPDLLPAELFCIVSFMESGDPAVLTQVKARLQAARSGEMGRMDDIRRADKLPCLFLQQGRCSIYPVRPLRCRAQFSPDAEACRQNYLGQRETMPLLSEPALLYHSLRTGLRLGLREVGLYDAPLKLSAAVALALEKPGVLSQWLAASGGAMEGNVTLEAIRYPQQADEEHALTRFSRQFRQQAKAEKEAMRQVMDMFLQRQGA